MIGVRCLPAVLVAGVGFGSLTLAQTAEAATIDPTPASVIAGQSITLTLNDTIAAASAIGAIDLQVTFDHSLLTLTSVTDGTLLVGWDAPIFNAGKGSIVVEEDAGFDPNGTGSVLLLTFAATATDATGSSAVTLQNSAGSTGVDGEYQLGQVSKSVGITAAAVTPPTTVPEPGALALLLAPLLAATGLMRRDRG